MLRRIGPVRHGVVGVSIVGMSALAAVGVIGAGDDGLLRSEHFDAKQVTVTPAGASFPDGVRVREVVDIDFGNQERRGYQRIIPNDFGVATDVTAFSPDANGELSVVELGASTRIRVGNPAITFTGRHRYEVGYVLPDAQLARGQLALDVIGTDETFRTDRFEVVLAGFDGLDEPECTTGPRGAIDGCDFRADGDRWVAVIEPLEPGEGISVFGSFESADPLAELPNVPAVPDRPAGVFWPLGLVVAGVGVLMAIGVFVAMRRRGSNVVFGTGAATDAAMGVPLPDPNAPVHDVVTHRVPDDRLAELATIEFVPPRGLEPWQGAALLSERVGDDTIRAWFGEMIARGTITTSGKGKEMELHAGPTDATLSARDRSLLSELFRHGPTVPLGTYRKSFAELWEKIGEQQAETVNAAGWWERPIAGHRFTAKALIGALTWVAMAGIVLISVTGPALFAFATSVRSPFAAVALAVLVVVGVSTLAYRAMLASRTATGSALTLRTESFRRFLDASEGQHVDWAWDQGVLREYSAWAVALGAADAWADAIKSSGVPDQRVHLNGPLVMHSNVAAFSSTTVAPSSSGSGGGGFGGGSVGGGGGGGSSGSW